VNVLLIGMTGDIRLLAAALAEVGAYTSLAFGIEEGVERAVAERPDLTVVELLDPTDALSLRQTQLLEGWTPAIILAPRDQRPDVNLPVMDWPDDVTALAAQMRQWIHERQDERRVDAAPSRSDPVVVGALRIDPRSAQAYVDGRDVKLTAAEFRILHALALAEGAPLARAELSQRTAVSGGRTITTQIRRIRQKLEQAGASSGYVATQTGHGYFLSSDASTTKKV
jgi:DNA-binding response OmpR family regulator